MAEPPQFESDTVEVDRTPTSGEERTIFETEEERARRIANDSNEQDMGERKRYADHAYGITQAWIGFLIVMTLAQFSLEPLGFGLSDPIFITVTDTRNRHLSMIEPMILGGWKRSVVVSVKT